MDCFDDLSGKIFSEANLPLGQRAKDFLHGAIEHPANKIVWFQASSTVFAAKLLQVAHQNHADALNTSAEASDRHARSLSVATWVLASAVAALVPVTVLTALGVIGRLG